MFQDAEVGATVSKKDFDAQESGLRADLINAQYDLKQAKFPVIILIAGNDRIGCNQLLDRLHEWMDARYIDTHIFGRPTQEESERPRFWRYWTSLPAKGKMGLFGNAWPLNAIADRATGQLSRKEYVQRLKHIQQFEQEQAVDGALILKFWIHLPHKEMKKRLKASRKDPNRIWWIEDIDWEVYEHHDELEQPITQMIKETDAENAPWFIVEGTDARFRDLNVTKTIRDQLQQRLATADNENQTPRPEVRIESAPPAASPNVFADVDLTQTLEKDDYRKQLDKYQRRLNHEMRSVWKERRTAVLAFEGWDAAGKGGVVRRMTGALPARSYNLVPIAAPTTEEILYHYLWRFWKHLPRGGRILIFDRSWYGRVLVERVESFATEPQWQRAYEEINDFEQQLVDHGIPVLKFWLHISPEEQMERFQAREHTSYKKYKITDEDYRNREKWDDYESAVNDMVARTSTKRAPWHIVPANDKRFARISVLKTVCKAFEKAF